METPVTANRFQSFTALALISFAIVLRLLPHPANFAPVAAISIFGGAVLPRKAALLVPLGAMLVSDMFIGFYDIMPVTWGCYLLIALASSLWLRKPTIMRGAGLAVASSLLFFIVTNLAVWIWSGMYVHDWHGLAQCYALALPFLRNTMLSDIAYTALLFGMYELAHSMASKRTTVIAHEL